MSYLPAFKPLNVQFAQPFIISTDFVKLFMENMTFPVAVSFKTAFTVMFSPYLVSFIYKIIPV